MAEGSSYGGYDFQTKGRLCLRLSNLQENHSAIYRVAMFPCHLQELSRALGTTTVSDVGDRLVKSELLCVILIDTFIVLFLLF